MPIPTEDIDTLSISSLFESQYEKSNDEQKIRNIINTLKSYDIYDFIKGVAALNLIAENQNKCMLFDVLIGCILAEGLGTFNSKIKMGISRFRKIINILDSLDLHSAIDPSENPFIERIMFGENYYIFSGINYIPGYTLQAFLRSILNTEMQFEKSFYQKIKEIIYPIIDYTSQTAKALDLKIESLKHVEVQNVFIPAAEKLDQLKRLVIINESIPSSWIFSGNSSECISDALSNSTQSFHSSPFLIDPYCGDIIVLNISLLPAFCIHKILELSVNWGCFNSIIQKYNQLIWTDCKESLRKLGHYKILEEKLGVALLSTDYYKEVVLAVSNDKIMVVQFLCDDGAEFEFKDLFGKYPNSKMGGLVAQRSEYFINKLPNLTSSDMFFILIISSFGREIGTSVNPVALPLLLNPYELHCISINESSQGNFIPRYIQSRRKYKMPTYTGISELNSIELYVSNDFSFYFRDDFNPDTDLLMIASGDSIDYILRAVKKEDRKLVQSSNDDYFAEVVLYDQYRKIYADLNITDNRVRLFVDCGSIGIWIVSDTINSEESFSILKVLCDTIAYWIAECAMSLQTSSFQWDIVTINVLFNEHIYDFSPVSASVDDWLKSLSCYSENNVITLELHSASSAIFIAENNIYEKALITLLLKKILSIGCNSSIDLDLIEAKFSNPIRKKIFSIEYSLVPYFKPLSSHYRRIYSEDESDLLDELGKALLATGHWAIGKVQQSNTILLCNEVVASLYEKLRALIAELNPRNLCELVYHDLEVVIYCTFLGQARYAFDLACHPELASEAMKRLNECNKSSRALKFLIEYVAACPPVGTKNIGKLEYEKLLATCSLIIDWAYHNDMYYYHMIQTPMEFLPSGRIGSKRKELDRLNEINIVARDRQLLRNSHPLIECFSKAHLVPDFIEQLDAAFFAEFGYSFNQFSRLIYAMLDIGDMMEEEVKVFEQNELMQKICETENTLSEDLCVKILSDISLRARDDYLNPPPPFRREDVYPWRFNRELSFTRRSVIIRSSTVIWGNRQLFHMYQFIIDLIQDGKLKARSKELRNFISIISNLRGKQFNDFVYEKIAAISNVRVWKNVSKINCKRICSSSNYALGDIDVLCIVPSTKKIIVAEVKDFGFAKSPYEMAQEYIKMFTDQPNALCFASKHARRIEWIQSHLDDVKAQYSLEEGNWSVIGIFIVSDEIVSNNFHKLPHNILVYTDIDNFTLFRT